MSDDQHPPLTTTDVVAALTGAERTTRKRRILISRPCYDKFHRCPGRNGGGMRYARVLFCEKGYLGEHYEKRAWRWRVARCAECRVFVLPYNIRYADWTWYRGRVRVWGMRFTRWLEQRRW